MGPSSKSHSREIATNDVRFRPLSALLCCSLIYWKLYYVNSTPLCADVMSEIPPKVKGGGDGEPGTEASFCYTTVTCTAVVEGDEKLKSSSSSAAGVKENGTSSSSKDEIVLETDL